ncbi:hypothetical protein P781_15500 [Vibrio mimicus CAIM 1883]|nr:hypothetical protein P780_15490 [Vibrio mimicus CAIM 1882]ERM53834.1 hypothetical protein P781_15500 [Vibrio mimicus CAIM 1883]
MSLRNAHSFSSWFEKDLLDVQKQRVGNGKEKSQSQKVRLADKSM